MLDYIIGKFRRVRQKARVSTGNAWLVYERAYNEKESKASSMREVNKRWGGKPNIYLLARARCYGIALRQGLCTYDKE
jgi:hypothetical protein